jgi:hypothetical protein
VSEEGMNLVICENNVNKVLLVGFNEVADAGGPKTAGILVGPVTFPFKPNNGV